MSAKGSVFFHTDQAETTHSLQGADCFISCGMDESAKFRENLLIALRESGLNEAELSVKAGLNRRAVTDIREQRVRSPKLSTVFALAKALNRDPGEMMGLGPRPKVQKDLADFLSQYDEADQQQLLAAIRAFPRQPAAGQ
jgi:transcriptional regulator with XRE-family HTH domain